MARFFINSVPGFSAVFSTDFKDDAADYVKTKLENIKDKIN